MPLVQLSQMASFRLLLDLVRQTLTLLRFLLNALQHDAWMGCSELSAEFVELWEGVHLKGWGVVVIYMSCRSLGSGVAAIKSPPVEVAKGSSALG